MKQLVQKNLPSTAGLEDDSDTHATVNGALKTEPESASTLKVYLPSCGTLCDFFWWTGKRGTDH
jgi:hypothetical protein